MHTLTKARASDAKHKPPRAADPPDEDEEPVEQAGWHVRVTQWLLAKAGAGYARAKQVLRAKATAAMDGGIAGLRKLRQRAVGAEESEERRGGNRDRPGSRSAGGQTGREPPAEPLVAPKPRRRLRSLLVYLSVMLAGSMIGVVLAYDLLAQLLDRRATELALQDTKLTKYAKSLKALRKQAERQEKKLTEAEARLAASFAENEKKLGELQAKRVETETQLASALAARPGNPPRRTGIVEDRSVARKNPPVSPKAVDCTLGRDNVSSILKGCIADMNGK